MSATDVPVKPSDILGIPVIGSKVFWSDPRGSFGIPVEYDKIAKPCWDSGFPLNPLGQVNWSESDEVGTLRGIHVSPHSKLVFAMGRGMFQNVVVDLRPGSATFRQFEVFILKAGMTLHIPPGFGNALQSLVPYAMYGYVLDGVFREDEEAVVRLSEFDICWQKPEVGLSDKDKAGLTLEQYRARVLSQRRA